ncbi:xylulose kinase-like [Oratosquilla oratoria]|uniref:xylulose kinase-like n=1 Tax=Oratosquilla oratoria TaxID=337810 RepID=UPI003F764130
MADNEHPSEMVSKTYLGFDFSTQRVKTIVINDNQEILHEADVQFDNDLPEYRTHGGINAHKDGMTVTAPTIMWVKALDMLMDKLRVSGADFSLVAAISGTGQQHGSVYWRVGARDTLKNLQPEKFLHDQMAMAFSITDSPVWMDSSTTLQCRNLEEKLGGAQNLADITGSRAYERFTGSQISKIYEKRKEAYKHTERISLVSSFACSIFLGDYAPIDLADGSGMNLLDINTKSWSQECLDACAPDLREKLGEAVPAHTNLGPVSAYFVDRYGFSPECAVIAFTGDNPASLAGMSLREGDIALSLGTSDSLFLWLKEPKPKLEGNILINPVDSEDYMGLLCFKNGSITRERIRDECSNGSWDIFNQLLDMTPRGNFGNIGMYYDHMEITPALKGVFRFNKSDDAVPRFTSHEVEVRALVEGQFLSKRVYAENLGYKIDSRTRVLATGGASNNLSLLQVLSDVFNAAVYVMDIANSASLGCAYRAKHGLLEGKFKDVIKAPDFKLACNPNTDAAQIYEPMVEKFRNLEECLVAGKK